MSMWATVLQLVALAALVAAGAFTSVPAVLAAVAVALFVVGNAAERR